MDAGLASLAAAPHSPASSKAAAMVRNGPAAADDRTRAAARQAAEEFEASFLTTMLEPMFEGLKAEAPFGGGHAERTYRSLLVSEYAKGIAGGGGIGIASEVYREILAAQEGANP